MFNQLVIDHLFHSRLIKILFRFFQFLFQTNSGQIPTCWFEPPVAEREDKIRINVFAEVYQAITWDMKEAVTNYLWNILGERVYGSEVDFINLYSIFQLQDAERKEKLVPLNTAADYIVLREPPEYFIGADGSLQAKS